MATTARPSTAPPLLMPVRVQLSVMMFLQFAVWGAWATIFYNYLQKTGFSATDAGVIAANMALGAILSSLFSGYIADRFLNAERLMGVCHLLGAVALYYIATVTRTEESVTLPLFGTYNAGFVKLFALTLAYAVLYNPTLVLANAITFRHVPDGTRDFPGIRVLGTLGWIVANLAIDALYTGGDRRASDTNGPLLLAAGLSAVLGLYAFSLPRTPPTGRAGDAIPIVKAFGLFKDPSFAVFFTVSLVITVALAFYYIVTERFLGEHVKIQNVPTTMAIGQVCELVFLPLLPLFLFRLGMKWVLALGMLCWGVRYLCFSQAGPGGAGFALAILGVALHGFCFDFFFAAGFIHCDNEAPSDIRASAQGLFSFLTYGIGMWLGTLLSGRLEGAVTTVTADGTKVIDWQTFWFVPAVGVLACMAVFVLFFRLTPRRVEPIAEPALDPDRGRLA